MSKIEQMSGAVRVSMSLAAPAAEGEPVRVSMLARAAQPFYHYGFGAYLIHDFSSMRHKDVIPIDWEHEEIVGKSTRIEVRPDGLHIEAEVIAGLTPEADEIIRLLAAAVPLEASIRFRDFDTLFFAPGTRTIVNGEEVVAPDDAPLCVIRDWTLTSCAICKEGYDPLTITEKEKTMLSIFRAKKEAALAAPAAAEEPAPKAPAPEAAAPEATAPETPEAPAATPASEEPAPALAITPAQLAEYAQEFGAEKAVEYVAAGLSLDEARARAYAAQKQELAALREEVAQLKAAAAQREPFQPLADAADPAPRIEGLSSRQSKLAAVYHPSNN